MAGQKPPQTPYSLSCEHGLVYIGANGDHLTGIPARDLSPDDVAALLDSRQVNQCIASGLYKIAHNKKSEVKPDEQ